MDSPDGLKVRVSLASEGYRDTARTTEIEVGSIEREEVSVAPALNDGLKDPWRFRRPTFVALFTLLPLLAMLYQMGDSPGRNGPGSHLEWAFAGFVGLVVWVVTYLAGERVSRKLAAAVDHDVPDVVERNRITVRPSQSLTLVGGQHRDGDGKERTVTCVRVEDAVVHQHKTLRAEYDDGSSGVLLADLSEEELEEVCARTRAHDIDVVEG